MQSYNVAEAKAHLSEILEKVSEGEEVLLTRRGQAIARVIPMERAGNILGSGKRDPNMNLDVIAKDEWWKASDDEGWYE